MVASRFLDEVISRQNKTYDITVIGAEPRGSYNRIMLSSVLAKDADESSIMQKDFPWFEEQGVRFLSGSAVTSINKTEKFVEIADGNKVSYDELVLATGSSAALIPAGNLHLANIFTFRTLGDTHAMLSVAKDAKNAVVIGGGLLGLEAAYGLAKSGLSVTLIHRTEWLLNRQLDKPAATMLKRVMEAMNIKFFLEDEVASFNGDDCITGATLKSGRTIAAELAVIATGIKPNIELGQTCGLDIDRAIKVDDFMSTSAPNISAIGECIQHNQDTFGLVDPLWRQAETLAARLVENKKIPFENSPIATKLKVSGVQVFSAGEVEAQEGDRTLTVSDERANIYRKLIIRNNRIVGIVLFGDVRSGQYYFELMQGESDIGALLPQLIFGEAYLPSSSETVAA